MLFLGWHFPHRSLSLKADGENTCWCARTSGMLRIRTRNVVGLEMESACALGSISTGCGDGNSTWKPCTLVKLLLRCEHLALEAEVKRGTTLVARLGAPVGSRFRSPRWTSSSLNSLKRTETARSSIGWVRGKSVWRPALSDVFSAGIGAANHGAHHLDRMCQGEISAEVGLVRLLFCANTYLASRQKSNLTTHQHLHWECQRK